MTYQVGDRLKVGEYICTVKFVGELPRWPNSVTYGVEWDDPSRGKNCGTYNGQSYFKTLHPQSGSFIRDAKLEADAFKGVSVHDAFCEKFTRGLEEIDQIDLGTKVIELPNITKIQSKFKSCKNLDRVFLDHCGINDEPLTEAQEKSLHRWSDNVHHLDLSYNLLCSFHRTCVLVEFFSNVSSLNLSRNVFSGGWDMLNGFVFPKVKELIVVGCQLNVEQLQKLVCCFPNLEILDVSWNMLSQLGRETINFPLTLKSLGLNGNRLNSVPFGLSDLSLQCLFLSDNSIEDVDTICATSLRYLDLSSNKIGNWKTLDVLNHNLTGLRSLRINDNPISSVTKQDSTFLETVARFDRLKVLDDSILSEEFRDDAELYFVSKVTNGEIDYDKSLRRWKALQEKFSPKKHNGVTQGSWLESSIITIRAIDENSKVGKECTLLTNFTVRHSKTIICRSLCLDSFDCELSLSITSEILQAMSLEFRPISYYGVSDNSTIYVKRKTHSGDKMKVDS